MGYAGADIVWIGAEHSSVSWETLEHMARACDCTGAVPMIRVNKQYPGYPSNIRKALEIGAGVVIIPHINTKAEAEAVVRAAKFSSDVKYGEWPGDQLRGWMDSRAAKYGMISGDKLASFSDKNTLIEIQLEEGRAVENVEEILSVEGIDMAHLAVGDYSNSIGLPGQSSHPKVKEAERIVDEAIKRRGLIQRARLNWKDVLTDPEKAKEKAKEDIKDGRTAFCMSSDLVIIREVVRSCKKLLDEAWEEVKAEKGKE